MVDLVAECALRYQRDEKLRQTKDPVAKQAIRYQFKQAAIARREAEADERRARAKMRRANAVKKRADRLSACVKKCGHVHAPKVYKK